MGKQPRSGNRTNATQWLYVMVNAPFVWRWKVGVTGYLFTRWR